MRFTLQSNKLFLIVLRKCIIACVCWGTLIAWCQFLSVNSIFPLFTKLWICLSIYPYHDSHVYQLIYQSVISVSNAQGRNFAVSKFEPQLRYHVQFRSTTLWECSEVPYLPSYRLNSTTTVLQNGFGIKWPIKVEMPLNKEKISIY